MRRKELIEDACIVAREVAVGSVAGAVGAAIAGAPVSTMAIVTGLGYGLFSAMSLPCKTVRQGGSGPATDFSSLSHTTWLSSLLHMLGSGYGGALYRLSIENSFANLSGGDFARSMFAGLPAAIVLQVASDLLTTATRDYFDMKLVEASPGLRRG